MKKYALIFAAFVFTGDFKQTVAAAESCAAGSAKANGFDEDQQVDATTLSFTNVDGKKVTIGIGDGFRAVYNTDQTLKGYKEATAEEIASWTDATNFTIPSATAPATTDGAPATPPATEESNSGTGN